MSPLEISKSDITLLNDAELRELVGMLCEAELKAQSLPVSGVFWGGSQTTADSGLDAEVKLDRPQPKPDFVPRSHTGIQVKKNSMSAQACFKEMHHKGKLRSIIKDLISEEGAYIIVSGKDDCTRTMLDKRIDKMREAISSQKKYKKLKIDFYGIDRLLTWLRKHPSISLWIRKKLGKPLLGWSNYGRWAATPDSIEDKYLVDDKLLVSNSTGSNTEGSNVLDGINEIRCILKKPKTAVRLTGLSGVGKTRFAQALFESEIGENTLNSSEVIYADLGEELTPSATDMLSQMIAQNERMILVLDNCPPKVHRSLQKTLKESNCLISILTIEYDISSDEPEETKVFHLEPASEEVVDSILQVRFPELSKNNTKTIADFSGGNFRLAIALANRVETGETLSQFTDEELFNRLFIQRKSEDQNLLECAGALSLVYSFSIKTDSEINELDVLAEISGKSRANLYRAASILFDRGLVQKRAHWRALLPHAFANKIAIQALSQIPINDILKVLTRPENIRLLTSFSKRLSYLHKSEEAKQVAAIWLAKDGILGDLKSLTERDITILNNIAPVNPQAVLDLFKLHSKDKDFTTRENLNFSNYIDLLRKLAYEEALFNDALSIIIKFAKSEKENENFDSIRNRLENLFKLYLSATNAKPGLRAQFLHELFFKGDSIDKKLALNLLSETFQTSYFTSSYDFNFGARPRDYGYTPKTSEEKQDWYRTFLSLALEIVNTGDEESKQAIRKILSRNFSNMWVHVGIINELETAMTKLAEGGFFYKGWKAIKDTLHFNKNMPADLVSRLKNLEDKLAPKDLNAEIDSLVFHDLHENFHFVEDQYEKDINIVKNKVRDIGGIVADKPELLQKMGNQLFTEFSGSQVFFGQGLAKNTKCKISLFDKLLSILSTVTTDQINYAVLCGFIEQTHAENPQLAQKFLDTAITHKKVRNWFVFLQCYVPINYKDYKRLNTLLDDTTVNLRQFNRLASGRCHEAISDENLASLIEKLISRDSGVSAALNLLVMRFHNKKDSKDHSENLLKVSRLVLIKIFDKVKNGENDLKDYNLNSVSKVCMNSTVSSNETKDVIQSLISAIKEHRLYSFNIENTLTTICSNHPVTILNETYCTYPEDERDLNLHLIFGRNFKDGSPFDELATSDGLVSWCEEGGDDRFLFVAKSIFPFDNKKTKEGDQEVNKLVFGQLASKILKNAPNKKEIIELFYQSCYPSSWSGSRVSIMQTRRKALEELNSDTDEEISTTSKKISEKYKEIEKKVKEEEQKRHSDQEQRFE